jgi:cytoskeletal protein CcmA (bactofilin family)
MKMSKEKISSGRLDTYIGEQTFFEGTLTSKENLSIYGNVKGSIECQGRVVVGESGKVEADIMANDVVVSGKIVGNVTAKSKLEMSPTGVIQGDIKTSRLIMEDGGKFDGHSEMLSSGSPAVKQKTVDETPALPAQEQPKLPRASRK